MSRSNQTEIRNPAQKWFKWSGSEGSLHFYDKEQKENIDVKIPFQFMVLDCLVCITGYSDEDKSGIWSNEIRKTSHGILTVRTKNGIKKQGLYADVKTFVGARFAQSVYIAYKNGGGEMQIGNLKLSGCAVSSWIEFIKNKDIYKGAIGIVGSEEDKKGTTKFFRPVFDHKEDVSPEANIRAMELDGELQEYLKAYFAARGQEIEETPLTGQDYIEARNRELEDFDKEQSASAAAGASNESLVGDNDFNVDEHDDIPF